MNVEPLENRVEAFGCRAFRVDGHDLEALAAPAALPPDGRPTVVLGRHRYLPRDGDPAGQRPQVPLFPLRRRLPLQTCWQPSKFGSEHRRDPCCRTSLE